MQFPKDYKPYTLNNESNGLLYGGVAVILYGIYRYNLVYLERNGLIERDPNQKHYKQ